MTFHRTTPQHFMVDSDIDDSNLPPNTMRVLIHLLRVLNGRDEASMPSHQEIGDHCFRNVCKSSEERRSLAFLAVVHLLLAKKIEITENVQ